MTLTPDRLARFARHIVLPEIGGAGQVALAKAHVVLIGVGGIGSPALQYLAGAGIGTVIGAGIPLLFLSTRSPLGEHARFMATPVAGGYVAGVVGSF